jgi:hypothetical protein
MELVKYQFTVALQLASNTLQGRNSFVTLLEHAVATSDASSIRYWLDAVAPRLGFRRTTDHLMRLMATNKEGVQKALYWMPLLAESDADRQKLEELTSALASS